MLLPQIFQIFSCLDQGFDNPHWQMVLEVFGHKFAQNAKIRLCDEVSNSINNLFLLFPTCLFATIYHQTKQVSQNDMSNTIVKSKVAKSH